MMGVVAALFVLNYLWTLFLTPWFSTLFGKPVWGLTLDAGLKSFLFLVAGFAALYKMKVSKSVNDLIDKVLHKKS